jgi:hypothetical protein
MKVSTMPQAIKTCRSQKIASLSLHLGDVVGIVGQRAGGL